MAGRLTGRCLGVGLVACLMLAVGCSRPVAEAGSRVTASKAASSAPAPMPQPVPPPLVDLSGGAEPGFAVTTVLAPDRWIEPGDYGWNADGVAEGPRRIVIDLSAQRIYVYRAGVEIGRSSIIYGADDKPTPIGVFPILEKDIDHISNLYDAPMPYMLRLTWDGVAIHGSEVAAENATHGCIGIPDEFAATLFEEAQLGDKVLVTNNWMTNVYAPQLAAAEADEGLPYYAGEIEDEISPLSEPDGSFGG